LQGKTPNALYEPILYGLQSSGKRIRPILALMGCHLLSVEYNAALPAAMAVEIFHNFTLLHDDIMDNATKRRGKASVYAKYGVPSAILSGDAMLIYGYQYLLSFQDKDTALSLSSIMTQNAIGVCEGQQMDMDFEESSSVTIEDYIDMITKKTSILLGASLEMGGVVAGADAQQRNHLFEFGKNIGIAFQIQDDILDAFGSEDETGKIKGGDIINNKKTYLYLKALELASLKQKKILTNHYNHHPDDPSIKIKEVLTIFKELAVEEYANQLKQSYLDLGISHLKEVEGDQEITDLLKKVSYYIIDRAK
jgi:geranylgeranyl diphosphate synthase type II